MSRAGDSLPGSRQNVVTPAQGFPAPTLFLEISFASRTTQGLLIHLFFYKDLFPAEADFLIFL